MARGEVRCLADGDRIQIASGATLLFRDEQATQPLRPSSLPPKGLLIDANTREVWVDGNCVCPPLSPQQFDFLWLLYQNAGKVCTREQIIRTVWSVDEPGLVSDETVDQLVARVRQRLREAGAKHNLIVTVRGHGFRFVTPP